jgi:AcrR family transcriptional regulator
MGIAERKEREKEQRRNDIMDAAERIFFRKGFDNSTMDEVAEEAELSKGTLYLYFKSKEDLQFALSRRGADVLADMIRKAISPGKSGYLNLLEMGAVFVDFSRRYSNYFQLFLHFQTSNLEALKIDKVTVEKYLTEQSPLALLNECVSKGIQDGSLRNDLPVSVFGATLWSQMMGVLVVMENKRDLYHMLGVREEDVLNAHLELVSHGSLNIK